MVSKFRHQWRQFSKFSSYQFRNMQSLILHLRTLLCQLSSFISFLSLLSYATDIIFENVFIFNNWTSLGLFPHSKRDIFGITFMKGNDMQIPNLHFHLGRMVLVIERKNSGTFHPLVFFTSCLLGFRRYFFNIEIMK